MKLYFTLSLLMFLCVASFSQGWVGNGGNILNSVNNSLALTPIFVGIGTSLPTSQFHTTGSVRFAGITNNNTYSRVLVQDNNGNLFYRDASTIGTSNAWLLTGNAATNPATNFLGTTDNNRLVFRTNNVEKMTVLANGNIGINTSTPKALFHVLGTGGNGNMAFPYEIGAVEKASDTKFGVYCANTNPINASASSVVLGYTGVTDANGFYPGYEMQYGSWTAGNLLRFNALERNAAGTVVTTAVNTYENVLVLGNNGRVGINLTSGTEVPVAPTANLHTNGTVRFQNLATSGGNYLVIDVNGNVFRSSNSIANRPISNEVSSDDPNSDDIKYLKNEVANLKSQVDQLINIINQKNPTIQFKNSKKGFLIYPNPAKDVIRISALNENSYGIKRVTFQNIDGKTINSFSMDNSLSIPTISAAPGMYIINIYENNTLLQTEKVVVSK